MSYILVSENEDANRGVKLTLEEDGTLLLETLSSKFPNGIGLKYKYYLQGNDDNIIIHTADIYPDHEGKIYLPSNDTQILEPYYCLKGDTQIESKKMVWYLNCIGFASCTTEESLHNAITNHFDSLANVTSVTIDKEKQIGHCTINYDVEKWSEVKKLINEKCTIDEIQCRLLIRYNTKDELFVRRPGDCSIHYESLVTMFLILHLNRDENVKDFSISCDNDVFGYFGDIVIETEYVTGSKVIYAILVKGIRYNHNMEPLKITLMPRVISGLVKRDNFHSENCERILITSFQLDTSNQYVILNGNEMKVEVKQKQKLSSFENYFEGNIYQFETCDNNAPQWIHNFCFYSEHALLDDIERDIKEKFNCNRHVLDHFYNCITNWKQERTRSHYKLDKWWCSTVWENFCGISLTKVQSETVDAVIGIIRDQFKTIDKKDACTEKKDAQISEMDQDRIIKLTEENVKLKCQLEKCNSDLETLTKALYPRCVFEKYEKRLIATVSRKIPDIASLNRQGQWDAILKNNGSGVQALKKNIEEAQLDVNDVPEIAANTYRLLCNPVHDCHKPMDKVLISQDVLNDKETKFMIAICKSYPLPNKVFEVVSSEQQNK